MSEYPKMLTAVVGNRIVPLVYPRGHLKCGHVIVNSAAEEKVARGIGVPLTAPEQVQKQIGYPIYVLPE